MRKSEVEMVKSEREKEEEIEAGVHDHPCPDVVEGGRDDRGSVVMEEEKLSVVVNPMWDFDVM
eukprot:scaffold8792_cov182-Ochromonas_danica.AAC.3